MSWTSPLTVARTTLPRDRRVGGLHELLEVGDRGLHGLGGLEHLGDDEFVGVEEPADLGHPDHQRAVDDVERRRRPRRACGRGRR